MPFKIPSLSSHAYNLYEFFKSTFEDEKFKGKPIFAGPEQAQNKNPGPEFQKVLQDMNSQMKMQSAELDKLRRKLVQYDKVIDKQNRSNQQRNSK